MGVGVIGIDADRTPNVVVEADNDGDNMALAWDAKTLAEGDTDADRESDGENDVMLTLAEGNALSPLDKEEDGEFEGVARGEIEQSATTERIRFPICCATMIFSAAVTATLRGHVNVARVPAPSICPHCAL